MHVQNCTSLKCDEATECFLVADIGYGSKAKEEQLTIQRSRWTNKDHQKRNPQHEKQVGTLDEREDQLQQHSRPDQEKLKLHAGL